MLITLVLIQLALPVGLLVWLALAPGQSRFGLWVQALATAIYLLAIALAGLWLVPPWWTPYLYGVLFVIALWIAWHRRRSSKRSPSGLLGWGVIAAFCALGVFAANVTVQSLTARIPPPESAVELAFPLRDGSYLIVNGGNDILLNAHQKTLRTNNPRFKLFRGNAYGLDIVKIDRLGIRASSLAPENPDAYLIYGAPVFAPCKGKIVALQDGLPDMQVPLVDRKNIAGNYVILRCGEFDVVMAHFRPGSLAVKVGDSVALGEQLAQVGNSGVSDEPHLHIHAQRPGSAEAPMSGDPLPMRFGGRFLVRSDRVSS